MSGESLIGSIRLLVLNNASYVSRDKLAFFFTFFSSSVAERAVFFPRPYGASSECKIPSTTNFYLFNLA